MKRISPGSASLGQKTGDSGAIQTVSAAWKDILPQVTELGQTIVERCAGEASRDQDVNVGTMPDRVPTIR